MIIRSSSICIPAEAWPPTSYSPSSAFPSPSMLHLICCVRSTDYQPIERYSDEQVLLTIWQLLTRRL